MVDVTRFRAAVVAAVLLLSGCSGDDEPSGAPAPSPPSPPASVTPTPSATPSPTPTPTPTPPHPVSLPALMQQPYDGGDLALGEVLETGDGYTRYAVTYGGAGLTVSGILNLPDGAGPFPVLVLAHGYIDPDVYTTGRGLRREQDYLARQGYAVLHTDYRNHAGSDDDPANEVRLRLGYTEDVVNAVLAVRNSGIPQLDGERVGLLGRSMGGGVALNTLVVQPGLVDAAVIYASVSSNTVQNFDQWTRGQPGAEDLTAEIVAAYGAPEANPAFWRDVSPVTFFDRVTEPVLIHHGTADDTCPPQWAHDTDAALRAAGKDVTLQLYEGEPHAFEAGWQLSIERTAAFFAQHLAS
ncbi:Prolyl oligopeptidase family protein [Jiangella alkaliphila]|uniref:Prolyl oligopeptidase family protein n=1 Tax=Jiangella alkaliphila TaxID=419479 RepID=A0A1H2LII3_9ACTN|nr:Prolyl oligopeptidase family protein [Jiangella alkaliphila]